MTFVLLNICFYKCKATVAQTRFWQFTITILAGLYYYFVSIKISYRSQHSRLLFYVVFRQPNRSVITIFCGKTIKQKRGEVLLQVGCHERQSKRVINKHFRFNLPPFCFHFLRTKCRSYKYMYLLFLALLPLLPWLKFIEKVDLFCFFLSLSPAQTFVTDKCDRETWVELVLSSSRLRKPRIMVVYICM